MSATQMNDTRSTPEKQPSIQILVGDALGHMNQLPDDSVQCCVTSPPYWGLRDYGSDGQIGLERTPEEYVEKLVSVFGEVRRVLREDGTLWLNLGDCYATGGGAVGRSPGGGDQGERFIRAGMINTQPNRMPIPGLKPKNLVGIPWRVAFALQADGWYLRSDIIWHKPNPMPESVRDRPTRAHEYIFLLTKSPLYFYDADAIKSEASTLYVDTTARTTKRDKQRGHVRRHSGFNGRWDHMSKDEQQSLGSNKRSVWTVATQSYREAHFATFPPKLIEPCVMAGSSIGDVVLDPFSGAGTTGVVAARLARGFVGIDINPEYAELSRKRIEDDAPLLNSVVVSS